MQLEYNSPNLVQRFLLVLFYHQTTRHQPWFECNPPSTSQGTTSSNLCYGLDPFEGKPPLHLWGNRWLSQSHECQWAGITCETVKSKEKQVTWLHMYRNQLNGPLPWEITLLPELKQLLLAWNMLTGVLPPELQFQESSPLHFLNLAWNEFIGTIPARWFENLNEQSAKLATLGISSNRLTGTIPSEVGLFPLKELYLENNTLTGSLPRELFDQTSFQLLNLRNNDLTGILPSEIVLLTNLQVLKLDHTGIGGSLHSEIGLLSQLGWIGVTFTNMQGTIPGELYGLKNLHTFAISNCNFSGTISSSLGQLTKLSTLHLANNQFHGSLPSEIEALTQLDNLLVNGNNELTGTVPVSLCQNYFADEKKSLRFVADCLPNTQTGVAAIQCTCCTSCCDETGVCLAS
ncbi:leucine Rich Repeat [Seminavis robusta]|uniref:Leucine Rich Repeat n=1 Tax=Seminavis robusta TaxID=568900 RepID=A0A9N8HRN4_9STRA|nr:leucine Rich Repeat [Seminavis robusta]|eukprot:Sro1418_g270960.1 leucine Rich Repeat (403) ;mRNA; f:10393-11751